MSTTAKLKAPKGVNVISVAGQEYKVVKGYVAVLTEHLEHLVGMGFTGADDEELVAADVDLQLPAGVTSSLALPTATDQATDALAAAPPESGTSLDPNDFPDAGTDIAEQNADAGAAADADAAPQASE